MCALLNTLLKSLQGDKFFCVNEACWDKMCFCQYIVIAKIFKWDKLLEKKGWAGPLHSGDFCLTWKKVDCVWDEKKIPELLLRHRKDSLDNLNLRIGLLLCIFWWKTTWAGEINHFSFVAAMDFWGIVFGTFVFLRTGLIFLFRFKLDYLYILGVYIVFWVQGIMLWDWYLSFVYIDIFSL